ncbi:MAG: methyltransferase [Planctomycetes bacterium SCN 63-9]|nr:MAG: methyltransferase [Planctomycetes bacterium SCN 63-9]
MNPSPREQLAQMIGGACVSQLIYVSAKLDLTTKLVDGPKTVEQLASATQTHAPSLHRILRALASVGIFEEGPAGTFSLTPLAEGLRSDAPDSQHAMAVMMGEEHYHSFGDLLFSVRTGRPSFEKIYGKPVFDYLGEHPDQARTFDAAMTSVHGRETDAMIDAYDFSGIGVLMDVGGGNGSMLIAVLKANPHLQGILFDLPHVIERAKPRIEAAGLADRCRVMEGSFFESIPQGADAYMMRHIIHDWNDERSVTILRNAGRASKPGGKLLVIEGVITPGNDPSFIKLLDIIMLTLPGGKERTEEEYRWLYEQTGFKLSRVIPTVSQMSIIEGEKV